MKSLVLATAALGVVAVSALTERTAAYELITHARISQSAFQPSEGIRRYLDDTLTRGSVDPCDGPLDSDSAEQSLKFVRQF